MYLIRLLIIAAMLIWRFYAIMSLSKVVTIPLPLLYFVLLKTYYHRLEKDSKP